MITDRARRNRDQGLGVLFLVVLVALGWFTVLIYDKAFSTSVDVVLRADRVGNQLKSGADVKVRGMVVGAVRDVRVDIGGKGVEVELAIDPDKIDSIPHDVTARLLPKTLFGQRYVSLVLPPSPDGRRLTAGDVITQDGSGAAVELEKALNDLMPVLQAMQPQKLSSTLGVLAQALDGRGKQLGETLVTLKNYLGELNQKMPELQSGLSKLADTAAVYEIAAPDIITALSDLTVTAKTVAEQRENVAALLSTGTAAANDLEKFFRANKNTLITLSDQSRPTLELLARYSPSFPCLVDAAAALKSKVDKVLGAGTNEPGLHVDLKVKPRREGRGQAALPPKGPRCYSAGGAVPAGLELPNSPAENQFITELLAPVYGVRAADLPDWTSLLVGPLLRGTEVTLS